MGRQGAQGADEAGGGLDLVGGDDAGGEEVGDVFSSR